MKSFIVFVTLVGALANDTALAQGTESDCEWCGAQDTPEEIKKLFYSLGLTGEFWNLV